MSSVIIGIIGVALFMGIAVSSAIFLGPRFEDAQSQSMGSSAVQGTASVAAAVNGYRVATGYSSGAGLENVYNLLSGGYLRAVPSNPVVTANDPQIVASTGLDYASTASASQPGWTPAYVFMSIGSDQAVCTQVQRIMGVLDSNGSVSSSQVDPATAAQARNAGCFRTNAAATQIAVGDYVVYARVGN